MTCSTPSCRIRRAAAATASSAETPAAGGPPSPASRQIFAVSLPSKWGRIWTAAADREGGAAPGIASAAAPADFSIVRREGLVLMNATTKRARPPGVKRKWRARPPCYHPRRQMSHRTCVVVLLAGLPCPRLGFLGTDAYGVRDPKS